MACDEVNIVRLSNYRLIYQEWFIDFLFWRRGVVCAYISARGGVYGNCVWRRWYDEAKYCSILELSLNLSRVVFYFLFWRRGLVCANILARGEVLEMAAGGGRMIKRILFDSRIIASFIASGLLLSFCRRDSVRANIVARGIVS